ncbi:RNA polymerase sigma factor [Chitinophaga japonensis]|uniref:RNA polymerase sigma-70 factor (ECF subfamily) n=1 Tax=Chitinophaga japonensis TaxID=104662 RepID=A0A562TCB9_CHIJA|nr:RNA polymerase sigma-70 factor [Chitinophaga japonensis]TWI91023.1 RNA polymerase sigma-70 factor (ECF subfamily) [Chitinophaga japonensis]
MHAITDTELLQQLRAGDEQAFRQLYNQYSRPLLAFIYQFTHSAVDAEDILQETFLKLWTNHRQLPEIDHFGNYLFIIARNKTLDHLRKTARQQRLVDQVWANITEAANGLEQQLDARESRHLIYHALSQLSQQKQTIFRLSRQEGLSHEAIAARLRLSKSRVKNLQVETLKHIRQFLAQHSLLLAFLFLLAFDPKRF